MRCRVAIAMEHNCCKAWLWCLWVFKGRQAGRQFLLLSVTIHASGWISGFVNNFGWFVDCSIWIPILDENLHNRHVCNCLFQLQTKGIHSAFTIYCELNGGKPENKVRWTGSSKHHLVLHFGFGVKDIVMLSIQFLGFGSRGVLELMQYRWLGLPPSKLQNHIYGMLKSCFYKLWTWWSKHQHTRTRWKHLGWSIAKLGPTRRKVPKIRSG